MSSIDTVIRDLADLIERGLVESFVEKGTGKTLYRLTSVGIGVAEELEKLERTLTDPQNN